MNSAKLEIKVASFGITLMNVFRALTFRMLLATLYHHVRNASKLGLVSISGELNISKEHDTRTGTIRLEDLFGRIHS